jgi:hypothetical protein
MLLFVCLLILFRPPLVVARIYIFLLNSGLIMFMAGLGANFDYFQICCLCCFVSYSYCFAVNCVVLCTVCVLMCTVPLPPGVNPIAVAYHIIHHINRIIYHI